MGRRVRGVDHLVVLLGRPVLGLHQRPDVVEEVDAEPAVIDGFRHGLDAIRLPTR